MGESNLVFEVASESKEFVGFKIENDKLRIVFPMGYRNSVASANNPTEIRDDIRNLKDIIYKSKNKEFIREEKEIVDTSFPFDEYMNVITYYLNNNCEFYKEKESIYDSSDSGRISWNRTIKTTKPSIINGQVYYLDTIRRHNNPKENDLITNINHYCVYQALLLFGPLFYNLMVEEPLNINSGEEEKQQWISFLYKKLNETNNDSNKLLFNSMITILEDTSRKENYKDFVFGIDKFESVWEDIIDYIFGTEFGADKKKYNPSIDWEYIFNTDSSLTSKASTELRPDTILIKDNVLYIIDAKYYSFGSTLDRDDLPHSSSIYKQFEYMEYAMSLKDKSYRVHNISPFILPYDKTKYKGFNESLMIGAKTGAKPLNNDSRTSGHVYAVLYDTKDAVETYLSNNKVFNVNSQCTLIGLLTN